LPPRSAGLLMQGMLALEGTVLLLLQTLGSVALFLRRRVVATLALGALQDYQFTSHFSPLHLLLDYYDISRTVVDAAVRD